MPRITLSTELKTEIKNLPDKEKDKLLLRLIPSNELLVEQLKFRLLEHEETTELRRTEVHDDWKKTEGKLLNTNWRGCKGPMIEFRRISAVVNRHVKVTKDNFGDVVLHLSILRCMFALLGPMLSGKFTFYDEKSTLILMKRLKRIMDLADSLHEDFRLEFAQDVVAIGKEINKCILFRNIAKTIKLDISEYAEY